MVRLNLTEEEKLLQKDIGKFVQDEIEPYSQEFEIKGEFPEQIFKKIAELGVLSLLVPESQGGVDMGIRALIILLEEISKSSASLSLSVGVQNLANYILSKEDKIEEEFLTGKKIVGISISDAINDNFIINGKYADWVLICKEGKIEIYDKNGIHTVSNNILGLKASGICKGKVIGKPVFEIGDINSINLLKFLIGGVSLGIIERVKNDAVEYAKQRVQFRSPIGSFGMVQEMLGKMEEKEMILKTFLYNIIEPITDMEASLVNAIAGDGVMYVADKGVQIYGGYGYTRDYPMEKFFRDAKVLQTMLGNGLKEYINIGKILASE